MGEEYYLTEEQKIQQEIEKEEKKGKKKKSKVRKFVRIGIIVGIVLFALQLAYEWLYSQYGVTQRKPVLYLYPEETTEVAARLDFNGKLTTTYPKYVDGWKVVAEPDGTLTDESGKTYNYLYWEGESTTKFDMSEGFCVKGEDTAEFLEKALAELGLTRREANEFIVYWLPLMENNNYNVISFQTDAYEENAKLFIDPNPDTVIRVFMTWYGSKKPVELPSQTLTAPERNGFVVVEWGGSEVRP